jgi:hypothetical protein
MYKKAVTNKTAGGIIALILIAAFLAATVFLAQYEKMTLVITGILVIFLVIIAFSMLGYKMRLAEMQEQFSDDLETSVDRCTEQAADKYFFFSDCVVDLENAHIYYYRDIAHIGGMMVAHPHHHGDPHRKRGAVITLRMQDGKEYMLANFQTGMRQNSGDIRDNYVVFCELMQKYWKDPNSQD